MMGNMDMSWTSMKSFLGQRAVKEQILNFDVRKLSTATRDAVRDLLAAKPDSFDEATVKRSSQAAAPLAVWVKAMIAYSQVVDRIRPLELGLKKLQDSLDASTARLLTLQHDLAKVDGDVLALKNNFSQLTREAEVLRLDFQRATDTVASASNLLSKLDGERVRWEEQVRSIDADILQLPRVCFSLFELFCGFDRMISSLNLFNCIPTLPALFLSRMCGCL